MVIVNTKKNAKENITKKIVKNWVPAKEQDLAPNDILKHAKDLTQTKDALLKMNVHTNIDVHVTPKESQIEWKKKVEV